MTKFANIGKISEKEDELLFWWIIPISWLMTKQEDICLMSPHFRLLNSNWYLTLYPNGYVQYQSKGWIGLNLHRTDSRPAISITYTIGINVRHGSNTFTKTHLFYGRHGHSGEPKLLKKTELEPQLSEHFNSVKITCRINNYSFTSLKVVSNSVSRAIQTEILDSVSCAIRTEIPDSMSCAVQTEVLDGVIDKENSKDEDGLSLDTKEVIILRDRMKDLLIKGSDYDVTICVQDKEFRAHRNILSARSPVFAMMFTHDTKENSTGTINIEDCDPDTFDEFLLYVYSGRTGNLTPSKALHLYYTADKYDFPVLKERCVRFLKMTLSVTSICDVVLLAAKHQEKELLETASKFFARNMEEILVSVSWQTFMIENPVEANELYIKSIKILVPRVCVQNNPFPKRLHVPKRTYSSQPE